LQEELTCMLKKTKNHDVFGLIRFVITLIVLAFLAYVDIHEAEAIPNAVYLLIGGLNGVDAYKLYNDVKRGYDKDDNK
jgi:hypothetical protein